jgi:hypothetical protein
LSNSSGGESDPEEDAEVINIDGILEEAKKQGFDL